MVSLHVEFKGKELMRNCASKSVIGIVIYWKHMRVDSVRPVVDMKGEVLGLIGKSLSQFKGFKPYLAMVPESTQTSLIASEHDVRQTNFPAGAGAGRAVRPAFLPRPEGVAGGPGTAHVPGCRDLQSDLRQGPLHRRLLGIFVCPNRRKISRNGLCGANVRLSSSTQD